jgi:hypothetical protein
MGNLCDSTLSMSIFNNVEIQVIDTENNTITKTVKTHNKATRRMVAGILRFINGKFTPTDRSEKSQYSNDVVKTFIPCYFNFGDGGVKIEDGKPKPNSSNVRIPDLDETWTEYVNYSSTHLVREFHGSRVQSRSLIRKQLSDTLDKSKVLSDGTLAGDMDSTLFECQGSPSIYNSVYNNNAVYITELGLFAGSEIGQDDLLAYVRLGNYIDEQNNLQTNALYVRPADTVIVRWVITIAAIGKDNVLHADIQDDTGKIIQDDIVEIPDIGKIDIEIR